MERPNYIRALDEHFAARYSDYVKISAIPGYVMPEVLYVAKDGNIARRDSSCMRLSEQKDCALLLARIKEEFVDTDFSFSFRLPRLRDRVKDFFGRKDTFARKLPVMLARSGENTESVGKALDIEPRFWKKLVKGELYPEKSTVFAVALAGRLQLEDAISLLGMCGFRFDHANVRDTVVEYLLVQKIFNPSMLFECLDEYHITSLPLKRNV